MKLKRPLGGGPFNQVSSCCSFWKLALPNSLGADTPSQASYVPSIQLIPLLYNADAPNATAKYGILGENKDLCLCFGMV